MDRLIYWIPRLVVVVWIGLVLASIGYGLVQFMQARMLPFFGN